MQREPTAVTEITHGSPRRPVRVRPPGKTLLAIGTGGMLGALARYGIGQSWSVGDGELPWPTVAINASGSLLLGMVVVLLLERWPPTRYVRAFVGIGVCGGYTTWSTFMTEAALLVRDGHAGLAAGHLAAGLVTGLAATYVGIGLARLLPAGTSGGPRETRRTR